MSPSWASPAVLSTQAGYCTKISADDHALTEYEVPETGTYTVSPSPPKHGAEGGGSQRARVMAGGELVREDRSKSQTGKDEAKKKSTDETRQRGNPARGSFTHLQPKSEK